MNNKSKSVNSGTVILSSPNGLTASTRLTTKAIVPACRMIISTDRVGKKKYREQKAKTRVDAAKAKVPPNVFLHFPMV